MREFLFWSHFILIVLAIASGFFLHWSVVLILIFFHKIHLLIFGDCILTRLKWHKRTIGAEENFLQYAVRRFFMKRITTQTSEYINHAIYALTTVASLSHLFYS